MTPQKMIEQIKRYDQLIHEIAGSTNQFDRDKLRFMCSRRMALIHKLAKIVDKEIAEIMKNKYKEVI